MGRTTSKDAQALIHSLCSAYAATPTSLKIIDLYVGFAVFAAIIQVVYMAIVGSFPFNSFLSGVLSCIGTAVLAVCLRIQVNKENKEFKVKIEPFWSAGSMFRWAVTVKHVYRVIPSIQQIFLRTWLILELLTCN
uniref:Dolichyl-diphosphooligosaccharide--protein glycosyltransferase subunit DAD1 n=1 Tax=Populus trichocarpa TaxID=3694 RepID=A0A3N7E9F9_POPTR